eukprot:gene6392-7125_t
MVASRFSLDPADILATLADGAPSEAVTNLLCEYNFEQSATKNRKAFLKHSEDDILTAIEYLKLQNHDLSGTKDDLTHKLLVIMNNRMPEECSLCNKEYIIELADNETPKCAMCGLGEHNPCLANLLGINIEELIQVDPSESQLRMSP